MTPSPVGAGSQQFTEKACVNVSSIYYIRLRHVRLCIANWNTKRPSSWHCWIHNLADPGMNRWRGKCSNSSWLMEQRGQNGGRRSDIMGTKGEMSRKRRKGPTGISQRRRKIFLGKEDRGSAFHGGPSTYKGRDKKWNGLVGHPADAGASRAPLLL